MSVKATIQAQLTVLETLTADVPDVASPGPSVRHDQFNVGPLSLNSGTTPPASQYSGQSYTGTQTLDLTALLGVNGSTINGNTLKPQALLIVNPSTNSGPLTVARGASNPIDPFVTGTGSLQIPKGGFILFGLGGNAPAAIGAAVKTMLFTPNSGADTYDVGILMG